MPHKYHAERRHPIPKVQYRVRNWRDDEAGLRWRGSLTIWVTGEAVETWRAAARTRQGTQPHVGPRTPGLRPRRVRKQENRGVPVPFAFVHQSNWRYENALNTKTPIQG